MVFSLLAAPTASSTRLRIGFPRPACGGLRWTRSKAWRGLDARDRSGQPVGRPSPHQQVQDAGLRRRANAFVGCAWPRSVPDRPPAWSRCRRTRPWTGRPRRRLPAGPIQPVRRRGGGLRPHPANARWGALRARQARPLRRAAPPRPCPGGHGCSPWTGSPPLSRAHAWRRPACLARLEFARPCTCATGNAPMNNVQSTLALDAWQWSNGQ